MNTLRPVIFLPGETIDEKDSICGCRVVDASRKGKTAYKLEIWLRTKDIGICNTVKRKMSSVGLDIELESQSLFERHLRKKY